MYINIIRSNYNISHVCVNILLDTNTNARYEYEYANSYEYELVKTKKGERKET